MTQSPDLVGEGAVALSKAAPPVAVTGLAVAGVSLQDWVFILTLVYLVLQISHLGLTAFSRKRENRDG